MRAYSPRDKMDALRRELDEIWLASEHDHAREGEIFAQMIALIPQLSTGVVDGKPRAVWQEENRARSRKYYREVQRFQRRRR